MLHVKHLKKKKTQKNTNLKRYMHPYVGSLLLLRYGSNLSVHSETDG